MKINFKRIAALGGSLLMAGMTMGVAAAANYPEPFVSGGSGDVAIIYGTGNLNTAGNTLDQVAADKIKEDLEDYVTGTTTVVGGDYVKFEKTSTKFHIGNGILDVKSTAITDDDLPTLLADGVYIDDDNDEFDYTQKVEMGNRSLDLWEDNDYAADQPTLGFRITNDQHILNYTLDFSENPVFADLETSTMELLGQDYYVLDVTLATNQTITLLDSAESTILAEGQSATVNGHDVSVNFISSSEVILNVDGTPTNSLAEGGTQKLSDGSYIGITDILFSSKDGTVSKVEFSIGNGKLKIVDGAEVELNEENVEGLTGFITNATSGTELTKIVLQWNSNDEQFVTPSSSLTMPGFGVLTLSMSEINFPVNEEIEIQNNGDQNIELSSFPMTGVTESIDLLYWNNTGFNLVGKDSDEIFLSSNATNLTFDSDVHSWVPVAWTDGSDYESYLLRASNFKTENSIDKATFQKRTSTGWSDVKTDAQAGDTFTMGNVEITVGPVSNSANTVEFWRSTGNKAVFDALYTEEGAKIYLPYNATGVNNVSIVSNTAYQNGEGACNAISNRLVGAKIQYNDSDTNVSTPHYCARTNVTITISEENKDEDIGRGNNFTVTFGDRGSSTNEVDVASYTGGSYTGDGIEIGDSDVFEDYAYTALATRALFDKSSDQETLKLVYHGSEVSADVLLSSSDAVVGGAGQLGNVIMMDSEVSQASSKNLIVVGGSCINSAAAALVGGPHCGPDWTAATGVGAGQFLIKGYADSSLTSKLALLVAGYAASDTTNAATYLRTQPEGPIDTSEAYIGTTENKATLQVNNA